MKYIKNLLFPSVIAMLLFACSKEPALPHYDNGAAVTLSSSVSTVAALPADSDNNAIKFMWTNPNYATDSSTVKYVVQIDSTGRNFAKAVSRTIIGSFSTNFTAKELNNILLGFGFNFNVAYDIDVRVLSSYGNNNEQYASNVVKVRATPYKVPPKVILPSSGHLFIVGNATQGGWNNPVPVPSQELTQLDETTWGGIFDLNGGGQYLLLPVNGDWSHKYSVANGGLPGLDAGGAFGYDLSDNFPGPASSGTYKIMVDFQQGQFTVTPYSGMPLPTNLFIVGDATPGGWNNPVPVPSQQLTRESNAQFSLTMPFNGSAQYLLLPVNGDWSHKYSVANNTLTGLSAGGAFGYDLSDNFPGPAASGNYKITVNFVTGKFKLQ